MISKLYATVLAVNVCADVACLRVRINGAYDDGILIPKNYPNNTICEITQFTVRVQEKPGIRPQDIAQAIPGEEIIISLNGSEIVSIALKNPPAPLSVTLKNIKCFRNN